MGSRMGRPGRKADATRARVLDAAAKVFREQGYIGARLSDIADVAGLQAGSLYYHFPSREALVEEVLRVGEQRTRDFVRHRVDGLPDGSSHADRLRTAITAQGVAVLDMSDYTSATIRITAQLPEDIRRRRLVAQQRYARYWDRLLAEAQNGNEIRRDVDLYIVRRLLLGALNSAAEWYHPGRGLPGEELGGQFAEVILHGLASGRSQSPVDAGLLADIKHGGLAQTDGNGGPSVTRQPRRAATRARILDAAAQVFHDNGYAGSRLTDIAAAAGLQTGSLYYHFSSREELVVELMHGAWERTNDFVRRGVNQLPPRSSELDRLRVAMRAHVVSALEKGTHTAAVVQIMGQVPEEVRLQSMADQRVYIAYWRGILERALSEEEIRDGFDLSALLMMMLGALNWTADWYRPQPKRSPERIAAQLAVAMIEGLATPGPAATLGSRRRAQASAKT